MYSDVIQDTVAQRILFVEKLMRNRRFFKKIDLEQLDWTGENFDTSYRHYSSMINYLCLTCFDILGQPTDWIDFQSWLKSKKNKNIIKERNLILNSISPNETKENVAIELHNGYNKLYGVKSSFYNFIQNRIQEKDRVKLFKSISVTKTIKESKTWVNEKGQNVTTLPLGEQVHLTDSEKKNFLFKLRNSFTHHGSSIGISMYIPDHMIDKRSGGAPIYEEMTKNNHLTYYARNWPFEMTDIIKSVIQRK